LGCSNVPRIDIKLIEPTPIPVGYLEDFGACEWDGDPTYQGLINHVNRLQQCLETARARLRQIAEWNAGQIEIYKKKKIELGIE